MTSESSRNADQSGTVVVIKAGDRFHANDNIGDYADWRMGIVDLEKVNFGSILRHSETATLDAFAMSGRRALALLEELAASAAVVSIGDS